ncbi:dimethylallyltransferase [Pilimelia anulata]|uniref:Dimethylallyltransferase n=1 Tax=Pilimelia anulata TaxID=53371 RepID=A0A8J3B9H2_9ACTN|nr:family 2 encapsulin nanocompartment cargo protein polyprenyl transferase [Pilimelia anulata]GGK05442.1 dimethylallyltransferase [Pilimelia anulata]
MTQTPARIAVDDLLRWSRALVEPALREAVDTLPESIRHICGYHFGWWEPSGRARAESGGKALRPALALLAAEAVSGVARSAVPAAVAVELVHNFSLLHDDVMDRDATRRHRPTAWTVFGESPAILAGDSLLALAYGALAAGTRATPSYDGIRLLGLAVQELIAGQYEDLAFEQRSNVTLDECLAMAEAKTGALLGYACGLGAWSAGAGADRVAGFVEFGRRLGLAFQVADDLLGIWGDPARTGKPVHADLRARKKSLPVVAALESGTPAGDELAGLYKGADPLDADRVARAAELVGAAGGRDWAHRYADGLLAECAGILRDADLPAPAAARLLALAAFATDRDR